jgi:two-component sensor histidine kinase
MAEYIPELVKSLEDGFDVSNRIHFKTDIAPVKLDISHAIPLGLIINEAVTNSIKYAFPDSRPGEISISMVDDGWQIKLELADNGVGMPKLAPGGQTGSLGIELMKGLSGDIDANIDFEIKNGTKITIKFKPEALNDQQSTAKLAETKEMYV